MVAPCCKTVMWVDNEQYYGNVIYVNGDSCNFSCPPTEICGRMFVNDWKNDPTMPELPPFKGKHGPFVGMEDLTEEFMELFGTWVGTDPEKQEGDKTSQEIIGDDAPTVLGLKEGEHVK